ncbi:MAG: hypothetical protein JST79_20765 [Acidobacteria bacterium]|nr:hypothetical protein [Acidobacteriota bacterium]
MTPFPTPAIITLSPTPTLSLELGKYQAFSATAYQKDRATTVTVPITFSSSNNSVATIAANGLVCAGTWNSLSNPQICTPGSTGTAQIIATAQGISSPPTTVFVHQHIDNVVVAPVSGQTPPPAYTAQGCFSKGTTYNFEARAYSRGTDITASAGDFAWQTVTANVAAVSAATSTNPIEGLLNGQAKITANIPGTTVLYATVGGVTSQPFSYVTCYVQSISLAIDGEPVNSISLAKGTSKTITPTITDIAGNEITGSFLTWSSSDPTISAVTTAGVVSTPQAGGATIIASCTPPNCNIGTHPAQPVYPQNSVYVSVTGTGTTATTLAYVTTSACGRTEGCFSIVAPINIPANTVGTLRSLPSTPNSFIFSKLSSGVKAYLGTDYRALNTKGLMTLDPSSSPPTVAQYISAAGKVLAISPDGKKVILAGTESLTDPSPTEIFVFDTSSNTSVVYPVAGATAADFSPDSLKAYIVSQDSAFCSNGCLYVYSTQDALQAIQLNAPANDVSFFPEGAFGFLAGGSASSAVTAWTTCGAGTSPASSFPVPLTPTLIKALPIDISNLAAPSAAGTPSTATAVLAVNSPGVDLFRVNSSPQGCAPTINGGAASSFNLGHGDFVPTQLLVSSAGTHAYILGNEASSGLPLASILEFNLVSQTSSSIALANNASPVRAALTGDGTLLYVTGTDGAIHVINTDANLDTQQITLDKTLCQTSTGDNFYPDAAQCIPDLIAIKP